MTFWTIFGIAAVILVWCLAWSLALLIRRQLGESVGGSEWERDSQLRGWAGWLCGWADLIDGTCRIATLGHWYPHLGMRTRVKYLLRDLTGEEQNGEILEMPVRPARREGDTVLTIAKTEDSDV